MRDRICIVCGEKAEIGNFCKDHYLERNNLTDVPDSIELNRCRECTKFNISGRLKRIDEETAIKEKLRQKFDMEEIDKIKIKKINDTNIEVKIIGELKGKHEKEETYKIRYKLTNRLCEDCTKRRGRYYEGIIQIRPKSIKALKKIINDESIVEAQELKEGFNVLVLTKKDQKRLVNRIRPMAEEVKESYTLIGVSKSGKRLTRTTTLLRIKDKD